MWKCTNKEQFGQHSFMTIQLKLKEGAENTSYFRFLTPERGSNKLIDYITSVKTMCDI